jgi:hypothetical protein
VKSNINTILIIVGIVVIAFIVLQINPEFSFNLGGFNFGGESPGANNYYNQTQTPASDSRAPSSLYAVVEPNPITMKQRVLGAVTSDGYKYPITVHAKHKGIGTEQTFGGLLDTSGRFIITQTIDLPGTWEFWVTSNTVKSNVVSVTVQGVATTSNRVTVSRSIDPTCIISVWSSSHGNAQVVANDPAHAVSIPLTNAVVNAGGYGSVQIDLGGLTLGTYEIDAVIGGETASSYGGACTVTLGR